MKTWSMAWKRLLSLLASVACCSRIATGLAGWKCTNTHLQIRKYTNHYLVECEPWDGGVLAVLPDGEQLRRVVEQVQHRLVVDLARPGGREGRGAKQWLTSR